MTKPGGWQPNAGDPDDKSLVEQTLGGDREAFGVLIRRYQRLVFRIVGGFLRNRGDVEDAAQDAFLRALEGLQGFRAGSPFAPWIAQIATRVCYDRLRQRQRRGEVAWEDLSSAEQGAARDLAEGASQVDRTAVRDLLDRGMASLAPKDRMVLILADALGFSGAEVARAMGCSPVAGRIRLHRARRALREIVETLLAGMHEGRRMRDAG